MFRNGVMRASFGIGPISVENQGKVWPIRWAYELPCIKLKDNQGRMVDDCSTIDQKTAVQHDTAEMIGSV